MKQAVSAIFLANNKIFSITRNDNLRVFPGYSAFPGGKVDKCDSERTSSLFQKYKNIISQERLNGLIREVQEELNFDIEANHALIVDLYPIGIAVTPEFNPYRFESYYYVIKLNSEIDFEVDTEEAKSWSWETPSELLNCYNKAQMLAVPPMVMMLEAFAVEISHQNILDLSLDYDPLVEVPMIESIKGVKQFLPLSKTFPPANRTNSFLIGDEGQTVLIDPSPKDENEYQKFLISLYKHDITKIFITHHHPDHHDYINRLATELHIKVGMSPKTFELMNLKYGTDYLDNLAIELYQEGDILTKSLNENVYVYAVPGHDAGQLALAPETLNWFLVGDLIQTVGTVVIGGVEGNMSDYYKSLQRVIDLKPKFIIPSHGISIGGTFKLEKTLRHRKKREEQILKLMLSGKSIDAVVDVLYADLDENLRYYGKKTIEAHIVKLQLENKLIKNPS